MTRKDTRAKKLITILIPIYNEEESLESLIDRLEGVRTTQINYDFEYLFINDGSSDGTLKGIKAYSQKYPQVHYVDLSRNFGKEIAMLAGFDHAHGDAVVIMDADLQHPPEYIHEMIHWWEQGYDDIYAVRAERQGENWFKELTSKTYYKTLQKLSEVDVYPLAGDFRLLDRKCIQALKELRESERYTKGMYGWIGFKKKEITYAADSRLAGEAKWSFSQLFKLALDGITSYSTVPLRIWSYIGLFISFLAFIYLVYEVGKTLIFGTAVSGYPSLLASILFLGGIQLISLGVIGEYLGRIFTETKRRPPYLTREVSTDTKVKSSKED